jgi:hypothetical protein
MTQESALTREEIEAMDRDIGTPGQQPAPSREETETGREQMAVRSEEPEAKS